MKRKTVNLGIYKGKLVPVRIKDLKVLVAELGENWGKPDPEDNSFRFIPLDFLETLVCDFGFNILIIK
jgi:hypothetical protein